MSPPPLPELSLPLVEDGDRAGTVLVAVVVVAVVLEAVLTVPVVLDARALPGDGDVPVLVEEVVTELVLSAMDKPRIRFHEVQATSWRPSSTCRSPLMADDEEDVSPLATSLHKQRVTKTDSSFMV